MSPDRLEGELLALAGRLAAGTYELLVFVGEFDARGSWALRGALSRAAWLADLCDIEATERIGLAETHPAGRLGVAIAAWSQRFEDDELIEKRQRDARSCSWRTEPNDIVTLTARLTPAAAGAVRAAIDAQVTRSGSTDGSCNADAPAGADHDAGTAYTSLAQHRADALVSLLTEPTDSPATTGVASEVVVHVTEHGNHLVNGTPLSDRSVTAMLPDAFVSLLMHDAERQPIDASPRRRFPTRRQRRIIDERHDECAHPGCHARTFLQYDHIIPYVAGGPTTIDNLQRLCGSHNRAKSDASAPPTNPDLPDRPRA